jgi:hypothetical protein
MPAGKNLLNLAETYNLSDQHGRLSGGSSASRGYMKQPWATQAEYDAQTQPANGNRYFGALNCTICHGPHGSENIYNLRSSITVAGQQLTVGGKDAFMDPALCTRQCNGGDGSDIDAELPEFGSTTYNLPLNGTNGQSGVQEDMGFGAWCTFCHEPSHGTSDGLACQSGHRHGGGNF